MLLHSHPSPVPVIDSDRDDWWRQARCAWSGLVYGYDGLPLDVEPPQYCVRCKPEVVHSLSRGASTAAVETVPR